MIVILGLFATLTAALATLLYVLAFAAAWTLFIVMAALFIGELLITRVVNSLVLTPPQRMRFAAMVWELIGGFGSWAGIIFGGLSAFLLIRALFFGQSWSPFVIAAIVSGLGLRLWRLSEAYKQAAAFKGQLVDKGFTIAEARVAWIAEAERLLRARRQTGR
jgi:hypothetical protein